MNALPIVIAGFVSLTSMWIHANHQCIHGEMKNWPSYREPDQMDVSYSISKHRFHEQDAAWSPIRVVFKFDQRDCSLGSCGHCETVGQLVPTFKGTTITCTADDILTTAKKTYMMDVLLANARSWFENVLQVVPVSGNLVITGSSCGPSPGIPIPRTDSTSGVPNADIVIYVSAVPAEHSSAVLGWASTCRIDANNRPVAAQINLVPSSLGNADILNPLSTQLDIDVATHELTHALGFSAPFFGSRGYLDLNGVFRSGGIISVSERGHVVRKINSPRVLQAARNYFNCSTLDGLEIEDQGGPGTAGTHWEKRVILPELMTGILSTPKTYFSNMTLAFLEDTGHYKVDYSKAQLMTWGQSKGCDFALLSCNSTQLKNSSEWCWTQDSSLDLCNQDLVAGGYCHITNYDSALPAYETYFNDSTQGGGTKLADYCPYVTMYSNRVCIDPLATDVPNIFGTNYGSSSRCFNSNLIKSGYMLEKQGTRCFPFTCSITGSLLLNIQGKTVGCPLNGNPGRANIAPLGSKYRGYINCPAAKALCAVNTSNPGPTASSASIPQSIQTLWAVMIGLATAILTAL